jgi:hypothetical protein
MVMRSGLKHVVAIEDRLNFLEIPFRRRDHAARADERLGDEGRNRIGPFL